MKEIFNYNGNNITFQSENGGVMVNLTQIARAFPKKNLSQILKSKEIKEYVQELSRYINLYNADSLVKTIHGDNGATWAHQKVALRVAQKLSPKFAVWVDTKIEELLKTGKAQFNNSTEDQAILQAMNILQNRVSKQTEQLQIQAPKVEYYDEVLQSTSTYTTNQIAKELGKSAISLNRILFDRHVQYKQNGTWLLYRAYENKGYTKTKTYTYTGSNGETKSSMQTVWTEKGRIFIHKLFNPLRKVS